MSREKDEKISTLFTQQKSSELIKELSKGNKDAVHVELEQGPLNKNSYTKELETVVKAFLQNKAGKSEDHVTFSVENGTLFATLKGEKLNINNDIGNANMGHFTCGEDNDSFDTEDMDNYVLFCSSTECQYEPRLNNVEGIPSDADYRSQEQKSKFPDALKHVTLAGKTGINIYTGPFYAKCNPLLRLDVKAIEDLEDNPEFAGEILATVAFACAGLNSIDEIPWCNLSLMSSNTVLEKNTLHLEMHNGSLKYHTLDPNGNPVTGVISQEQLPDCILDEKTTLDDLWPFSSNILKITSERNHTPPTSIPESSFRMEQSHKALNLRRIEAIKTGKIIQESSIYSTATDISSPSDAKENKMGIDEGYCTGVVFDNLRGKYTAGIARKPYEAEYTIPPTQVQYVSYHVNSAGGLIFHATPVNTPAGLSEEQKCGNLIKNQSNPDAEYISNFKSFKESNKEIRELNKDDNLESSPSMVKK